MARASKKSPEEKLRIVLSVLRGEATAIEDLVRTALRRLAR